MAKQHPLYHIALEFMERFPKAKRFGRAANERHLQKVMEDAGWDSAHLLWVIRQWSLTRNDLAPWDLLKPLPQRTIETVKTAPPPRPPKPIPEFPAEWRGRASWFYRPLEDDDV